MDKEINTPNLPLGSPFGIASVVGLSLLQMVLLSEVVYWAIRHKSQWAELEPIAVYLAVIFTTGSWIRALYMHGRLRAMMKDPIPAEVEGARSAQLFYAQVETLLSWLWASQISVLILSNSLMFHR